MNRLEAQQDSVIVVGLGTDLYVDYVCPLGHAVMITHVYGFHNEGGNLNCLYQLDTDNGLGFIDLCQQTTYGSGIYHQLYSTVFTPSVFLLRGGQTLRWRMNGKTAGKIGTLVLIVDRYKGETAYGG
jgi:hypothetical protein